MSAEDTTQVSEASSQIKRIYVSNLDFSTTEEELSEFLKEYNVVSVLIPSQTIRGFRNSTVRPLGIGYADFQSAQDAQNAAQNLNGKQLKDRKLKIKIYVPYSPKPSGSRKKEQSSNTQETQPPISEAQAPESQQPAHPNEPVSTDTVYCAYLPSKVTDVELRDFFAEYQPQDIYVYRSNGSRHRIYLHRRFTAALVTLAAPDKLNEAIETLGSQKFMGKKITLKPARLSKIQEVQSAAAKKLEIERAQQHKREIAENAIAIEEHRELEAEIPEPEARQTEPATA